MLKELLDWIESKTSYVVGTNLFLANIPDDVDDGIACFQAGGDENESNLNSIQVNFIATGIDYTTAETLINDIYLLLAYSKGIQLASSYILNSVPMGIPRFLTINEHKRYVFSASFIIYKDR